MKKINKKQFFKFAEEIGIEKYQKEIFPKTFKEIFNENINDSIEIFFRNKN